jgi:hypothetical protein
MSRSEQLFEQGIDAVPDLLQEAIALRQDSLGLLYVHAEDHVDLITEFVDQSTELIIKDLGTDCGHPPVGRSAGPEDRLMVHRLLAGFGRPIVDLNLCHQGGLPVGGEGVVQREDGVTLKGVAFRAGFAQR